MAAAKQTMELRSPCHAGDSPKHSGLLADSFDEINDSRALSLVDGNPDVTSQVLENEKLTMIGSSTIGKGRQETGTVMYQSMEAFSLQEKKGEKRKYKTALVVADSAGKLHVTEAMNKRFVIKDVKAMLQTGQLEGQQISYRTNKKNPLNLLDGVIRGTSYYCSCGDCDHDGKALSAKAFEQHALKGGYSSNPNDHIVLCSSNISVFEAFRKLREGRNEAMLEDTSDIIKKTDHAVETKKNMGAAVDNKFVNADLIQTVRDLQKWMEKMQAQVDTIEKNIDFFCKEMIRYQKLHQGISKIMGEFVDNM